jgi:hypothetical protein
MATRRRSRRKSISGNLTDIQKRIRYLETRPAAGRLASKAVATRNLALRAVDADIVADNAVVRRTIGPQAVASANLSVVGDPDGAAVATENIQDLAVDTPQVADEAITTGKIDDLSVTTAKIDNEAVTTAKIDSLAVVTAKIDDLAVVTAKIDDFAVITEKIDDLAVTNEKLAGLITSDKIDSIDAATITVGTIVDDQLDGMSTDKLIGTILADQLAGSITFDLIDSVDAGTITVGEIQDDQIAGISGEKIIGGIDGALIVAGSIPPTAIEPDSITENQLDRDSVGFDELQFDSVSYGAIQENAVGELSIDNLAIARRHMQDNVIIARMINPGAVTNTALGSLSVSEGKIQDGAVTGAKIENATITSGKISTASFGPIVDLGLRVTSPITKSLITGGGSGAIGDVSIGISVGSGAAQVAEGDHTHGVGGYTSAASSGVPSHTHPVSLSDTSSEDGSHGGHSTASGGTAIRGLHDHSVTIDGRTGTPSTIKLKKEVTDYSMVDVKNLLNLNLKRYKYKNQARNLQEGREWMYGYIAEEVEELGIKEIIGYDENKEPNAINYGLLSTLVLELVKVQQTEIDSLKEEIQRLKETI